MSGKPVLVLLPGMDGTGDLFDPLVNVLSNTVDIVVVRYPLTEPMGYEPLIELARRALPGDRPFFLLGESFSGPIAVALAAEQPTGLRGLILVASFLRTPTPWLKPFRSVIGMAPVMPIARLIAPRLLLGRHETSSTRNLLLRALNQLSPAALKARARASLDVDVSSLFSTLEVPSLYLQAMDDAVLSDSVINDFLSHARAGRVKRIQAPHCLLQVAPQAAASALRAFFAEQGF